MICLCAALESGSPNGVLRHRPGKGVPNLDDPFDHVHFRPAQHQELPEPHFGSEHSSLQVCLIRNFT